MMKIGIIGGSGLYAIEGMRNIKKVRISTPFGSPSDAYISGELCGKQVVFLPRHGVGHKLMPSEVNYRANIYGMKELGVEAVISVSACGSLRQKLKPMDFVIPDQFVDRTNQARPQTFFGNGVVAHVALAHPVCACLAKKIKDACKKARVTAHAGGTYLNMEGPQFSTKAESELYRRWGMDIIGMTNMVEARLAREAELCYASLAAVTDYDCWHPDHDSVTVDMIIQNLMRNVENAKKVIAEVVRVFDGACTCGCKEALACALITDKKIIPASARKKLKLIIGKYL